MPLEPHTRCSHQIPQQQLLSLYLTPAHSWQGSALHHPPQSRSPSPAPILLDVAASQTPLRFTRRNPRPAAPFLSPSLPSSSHPHLLTKTLTPLAASMQTRSAFLTLNPSSRSASPSVHLSSPTTSHAFLCSPSVHLSSPTTSHAFLCSPSLSSPSSATHSRTEEPHSLPSCVQRQKLVLSSTKNHTPAPAPTLFPVRPNRRTPCLSTLGVTLSHSSFNAHSRTQQHSPIPVSLSSSTSTACTPP